MPKRVAKLRIPPLVPYSERRNERCWRWSGNRQTDTRVRTHARTRTVTFCACAEKDVRMLSNECGLYCIIVGHFHSAENAHALWAGSVGISIRFVSLSVRRVRRRPGVWH